MMQIYLIHKNHGKKIAGQFQEAEMDKKHGWKEVTKEQFFNLKPKKEAKEEQEPAE